MKNERGNKLQQQKHRNMVQFETPVRWVDGKTKGGRRLFIFGFVC